MISTNLLPPEIKEEISQTKKNREVLSLFSRMIFMTGFIALLIFSLNYFMEYQRKEAAKKAFETQKIVSDYGTLERDAKKIADRIKAIKNISENTYTWLKTLNELQAVIPEGTSLDTFKVDTTSKTTRGQITGKAQSQRDIAALRDAMDKSSKFEFVDIDLSQTQTDPSTKATRQVFAISFSLTKEALK